MKTVADLDADRIRTVMRALVRRFQLAERADISCCGLTVAQAATLGVLAECGELRLGELGRRLGISASTLSRNLARLEERELVTRIADPHDARAARVALTESGHAASRGVARQEECFAKGVLERLPPGTARRTVDALEQLLVAVRGATESCCPGAFDHLMTGPEWTRRRLPEEP